MHKPFEQRSSCDVRRAAEGAQVQVHGALCQEMPNLEDPFGGLRRREAEISIRAVTDVVGVWQGQLVPAVVGADGEWRGRAVPVLRDDAAKSRGHAGPVQWGDAGKRSGHAAPVPVDDVTKRSGRSTRAAADVVVVPVRDVWLYGNERCVGDLATVLLHSCVRPAPPQDSVWSECGDGAPVTLAAVDE
jgi:hypothetical protein